MAQTICSLFLTFAVTGVSISFRLNSLGNSIKALGARPLAGVAVLRKIAKLAPHFKIKYFNIHHVRNAQKINLKSVVPKCKIRCFACNDTRLVQSSSRSPLQFATMEPARIRAQPRLTLFRDFSASSMNCSTALGYACQESPSQIQLKSLPVCLAHRSQRPSRS